VTKHWNTLKFPTMKTDFEMDVIVNETPGKRGPLGVVGIGEMTMVCTAPAVINAICTRAAQGSITWLRRRRIKAALAAKR